MKKFKYILLLAVGLSTLSGCYGDLEKEAANLGNMAGEWFTTSKIDGVDPFDGGYTLLHTYNTAANGVDSMWITDDNHNYWFKFKIGIDHNSKTFSGTALKSSIIDPNNSLYEIDVDVSNGQIFEGVGVTKTGAKTDSIYMEVVFGDWGPDVFVISGHRRSGFAADEF